MLGWKNLPIKMKLPLTFAAVAILVTLTMSIGSSLIARSAQNELIRENFSASGASRRDQLQEWLKTVHAAVVTASSGTQASAAIYSMGSAFKDLGDDAQALLQADYIANNEYPAGQRQMLDRAEGSAYYHSQHFTYHPAFRTLIEQQGFYDLFLVDKAGNIIYTVYKEADFGANLQTGSLSDSNLALVVAQAMAGKRGDVFYSEFSPYAPSNYAPAMFAATPVMNDLDKIIGVMAVQLSFDEITRTLAMDTLTGATTNIYLTDNSGIFMTSSRFEDGFKGGDNATDLIQVADAIKGTTGYYKNTKLTSGNMGIAETFKIDNGSNTWNLVIERDNADVMASFNALLTLEVILGSVCFVVAIGIGIWVSRGYTGPISKLNADIQNVAASDFDSPIENTDRGDELGTIARSLDGLRNVLAAGHAQEEKREENRRQQSAVVDSLTAGLRDLATGDLTKSITEPFAPDYEVLREYFNEAMAKMGDAVAQISTASEGIQAQAGEITRSSEELAHRTEVQAATLEQTAAAMDEMTSSVKSAAVGVEEVETIVRDARKDADQSGVVVSEAVAAMAEIEKSSDQISQIIGVIDDIAFQTNLLALNAGVEAARAGDAGRGFAVVASEVGALAQRASSAAKEIKSLIGASSEHVERGVDRVKQAGETLQQIAKRVTHISTLTSNIATGAREQSIGLNEINLGVTQLDQATQKNAAMAEEATAASQLLKQGASELMDLVGRFKLDGQKTHARNLVDLSDFADLDTEAAAFAADDEAPMPKAVGDGRGIWQDF